MQLLTSMGNCKDITLTYDTASGRGERSGFRSDKKMCRFNTKTILITKIILLVLIALLAVVI